MHPLLPYLTTSYSNWASCTAVYLSNTQSAHRLGVTAITQESNSAIPTPPQAVLSPSRPTLARPCAWTFASGSVTSPSFKLVRLQAKLAYLAGGYKRERKQSERIEGAWEWEEHLFVAEEEDDFGDSDSASFSSDDSLRSSPPSIIFESSIPPLFADLPHLADGLDHSDEAEAIAEEECRTEGDELSSTESVAEELYLDGLVSTQTYGDLYPGEAENDDAYFAEPPTFANPPSSSHHIELNRTLDFEMSHADQLELESASSPILEPTPIRINLPSPTPPVAFQRLPFDTHRGHLDEPQDDDFLPTFIHLPSLRKLPPLPRRPRKRFSAPNQSIHREVVLWASLKAARWLNDWQKCNSFEELREW